MFEKNSSRERKLPIMALHTLIILSSILSLLVQSRLYQHTKYQIGSIQIPSYSSSPYTFTKSKTSKNENKNIDNHSSHCIFDQINFLPRTDQIGIQTNLNNTQQIFILPFLHFNSNHIIPLSPIRYRSHHQKLTISALQSSLKHNYHHHVYQHI